MKKTLWIFLFLGVLVGVFFWLRRTDKLEIAGGVDLDPDIVMDKGIFLPGNGIGTITPINGIYYPHVDDPIWLKEYYGLGEPVKPLPKLGNGIGIITPFPMPIPAPITLPFWASDLIAKEGIGDFIRAEILLGKGCLIPLINKEQIRARLESLKIASVLGL